MTPNPEPDHDHRLITDAHVFVDLDNELLASSNPVASIQERAHQTRARIESVVGGKPRVLLGFVSDRTHADAVRAYTAAGFTVRSCPPLGGSGEASTDHQMIAEMVHLAHALSPRRTFAVTADCGFVAPLTVLAQLGVETHVLTPSATVPKALRAASLTAQPLWPSEPQAAPPSPDLAAMHQATGGHARQAPPDHPSAPTRAAAGAPASAYRDICCPLQTSGLAIPAIDSDRLAEALRLADLALDRRDPVPAMITMAKSLGLGLRPAEVGFLLRAVREGRYMAHVMGDDAPDIGLAFANGMEMIAWQNGCDLGRIDDALNEWLVKPETVPALMGRADEIVEVTA